MREQFLVQLKVRSAQPFTAEDTHNIIAAISRIEKSADYHVYVFVSPVK